MKLTKKLITLFLVVVMLVTMFPATVTFAAPAVTEKTIQTKIEKLVSDLGLGETGASIRWYFNKNIRDNNSTTTLKNGINNYIKTGDISYIKAHLNEYSPCNGRYANGNNTHLNEKIVSGKSGCTSNIFSGSAQCWGFARYIEYYLFGSVDNDGLGNFTEFKLASGSDLKPGDHIRKKGHSFIYYGTNSSGQLLCIQANGYSSSKPCGLNYGRVWYDDYSYYTTSNVVGATIWRYNNITKCEHKEVTFKSDYNVPCKVCGENLAYPAETPMGAYMDVIDVNKDSKSAPSHVTPYGDAKIGIRYNKGDTVYVVASVQNGFKNTWYKLTDGSWLSGSYLGSHKHKKTKGFCTYCTDGLDIVQLNNFKISAKKSSYPVHFAPYGASPKYNRSGTATVTGKVVNGYKKVWYRLSDGGWVFQDYYLNPQMQTGIVNISGDTLALNNKAAASTTSGTKMIAELSSGTTLTIYPGENVGKWYSVRAGNRVGYAYSNWIKITDATKSVEVYPSDPEPGLSASDVEDFLTPSTPAPTPTPSASVSVLYPTEGAYVNKFSVSETNAVVVANIKKSSGSKVTACGLLLYDANGGLIKDHKENVSNVGASNTNFHTWYDINTELGITLKGGTTYKYRFYTVVDGTTYYGDTYSFTTKNPVNTVKATVLYPTEEAYLNKFSVSETNAVVVANVKKNSGSNVTVCGLLLYDANGGLIKDYRESVSNVGASNTNFHTWYDINTELGITLKGGTTYKYRFYTVVDGATYYGDTYSFTTLVPKDVPQQEIKEEIKEEIKQETEEKSEDVYYNLIFNPNGGKCDVSHNAVKFDTLIGKMPVPTRSGYTFTGWYSAAEGGNLIHENMRYNAPFDVTVYAHWEKNGGTIKLWIDNPKFEVNGKKNNIDNEGTVPLIRGGRTLVPIRAIAEAMGGTVGWDAENRAVTVTVGEQNIRMVVYMPFARVNGEAKVLDVPSEIIGGRTMVPIRFVAENLNAEVSWDDKERCITIKY